MKYSVIIRCYNTLPLIKKCVEAVIQSTDFDTEIILINNHPPYNEVAQYLANISHPRIIILDPGKNIGNLEGFNYGANYAKGENLIILDDDIIVPNNNWIDNMSRSLDDFPNLGYVSLMAKHSELFIFNNNEQLKNEIINKKDYSILITTDMVIFGCVMLKRDLWERYFSKIKLEIMVLYDIDLYYKMVAEKNGLDTGYIVSHLADHLGRSEESDFAYGVWKVLYVYGLVFEDYGEWRRDKKNITSMEEEVLIKFGYTKEQIKNFSI
ncbi:glycosyltransferase family 2 protein [Bacillus mycoides]|uniref:glycosyltransferase family 2 protein n=1 Tax=Bacillus mycoides TaxID=1405 RepID=UPI003D654A82